MKNREQLFLTVLFFLFLSITLFFVGRSAFFSPVTGFLEIIVRRFYIPQNLFSNTKFVELQKENRDLQKKLVDQQELQKENNALKDQFATVYPKSQSLLPAKIVGSPKFFPGVSLPSKYTINIGKKDGAVLNQAVIVKDVLVGKITKVSEKLSVVTLITDPSLSMTAIAQDGVLGVIKGQEEETLLFTNVLSSQTLHVGDIVATKGDVDENGIGYPPNLVVGKIISIEKTQSDLFQTALVKSAVDFASLNMVFVVILTE